MSEFKTLTKAALQQLELAAQGHVFNAETGENLTIKNANIDGASVPFTDATGGAGGVGPYSDHTTAASAEATPMDVDAAATILAIDYGSQIYKKAQNQAVFLEFLRAKGSVVPTTSAVHLMPQMDEIQSGFIREDGADVKHAELGVGSPKYRVAAIGLEYDYTDILAQADKVPLATARQGLDIENRFYLANVKFMNDVLIGEAPGRTNQFDGLKKATGTTAALSVTGLETAFETCADAGANPDFILTNRKGARALAASADIDDFVPVKEDGKRVIGKSVTAFDSGDGLTPIVVDNNITGVKAYVGDSNNFDIRILADGIRVPQGKKFLMNSVIFYTAAMSAMINPASFVKLENTPTPTNIEFTVTGVAADTTVTFTAGTDTPITGKTDADGKVTVGLLDKTYTITITGKTITPETVTVTAGVASAVAITAT